MKKDITFRLTGDYRGLERGGHYTTTELSIESGINLETLRERLARRGKRDTVTPADLNPVGQYKLDVRHCITDSDILSMEWLRKPLC